jgi:hypothetical protein
MLLGGTDEPAAPDLLIGQGICKVLAPRVRVLEPPILRPGQEDEEWRDINRLPAVRSKLRNRLTGTQSVFNGRGKLPTPSIKKRLEPPVGLEPTAC